VVLSKVIAIICLKVRQPVYAKTYGTVPRHVIVPQASGSSGTATGGS
jgi:hypothetical protein